MQGGAASSIVTDHLGTPVALYDGEGTQQWASGISIWGALRDFEGPEDSDGNGARNGDGTLAERLLVPFRWPGQYEGAETGLYYNRFRYYDPEAGQYTQQDPIGTDATLRMFEYVGDPLVEVDRLGLWRRRRNNGQFAKKPGPKPKKSSHGNARSDKPAILYARSDEDGNFKKWGITQEVDNPERRYGTDLGNDDLVEIDRGRRSSMMDLERELEMKDPGPENRTSYAGKKQGEPLSPRA